MKQNPKNRPPPPEDKKKHKPQAMSSYNFSRNYRLRQSFFVLIFRLMTLEFIFALSLWTVYRLPHLFQVDEFFFFRISFWILHALNFLSILIIILVWTTTYYILSPNAILKSQGVIARRTVTCDMPSIRSVKVKQSVVQRLFDYGSLELESPLLVKSFMIKNVQKPYKHAKLIDYSRLEQLESANVGHITPVI